MEQKSEEINKAKDPLLNNGKIALTPILLPTEDASNLGINPNDIHNKPRLYIHEYPIRCEKHHLYLCSTLPIKEGDWYLVELFKITGESDGLHLEKCTKIEDVWCNKYDVVQTRHKDNCKKIIFTTDPKLIADGVPAINGNTKAIIKVDFTKEYSEEHEVNFLEEFCKRWNEKSSEKCQRCGLSVDEHKPDDYLCYNQKDNQKVDVEKLATIEAMKFEGISDKYFEGISYNSDFKQGFLKALQSSGGGFSLEDMMAFGKFVDNYYNEERAKVEVNEMLEEFTKEQPKGDIVIEYNDGNLIFK